MGDVVEVLEGVLGSRTGRRGVWGIGLGALVLAGGLGVLQPFRARVTSPATAPTREELREARRHALQVLANDLKQGSDAARRAAVQAAGWSRTTPLRVELEALLDPGNAALTTQVAEALGKLGDPQAIPKLRSLLAHEAPSADLRRARLAVARALVTLGAKEGHDVLQDALRLPLDPSASPQSADRRNERIAAALLLCDTDDETAQTVLAQILAEPSTHAATTLEILACQGQRQQGIAARQALQRLWHTSQGQDRLHVALRLAALGDPEARRYLREKLTDRSATSATGTPEALLAARALAAADEPDVLHLVRRTLQRGGIDATARTLASEALGLCGELADLRALKQQLDLFDSPPVRQTTAAAILLLSALDPGDLDEASLKWARAALGDSDLSARLSAIAALGYSPQAESLELLSLALRDASPAVRREAVRALAQRRSEASLRLMQRALHDADADVRSTALLAIVGVLRSLGPDGMGSLVAEALGWIAQSMQDSPDWLRDIARLALGDTTQQNERPNLQAIADPAAQRWLIELGLLPREKLIQLCTSQDAMLRLAAARALLFETTQAAHDAIEQAIAGLRAQGGRFALDAAGLQLAIRDAEPPRTELLIAARSADSEIRRHVLDVMAWLPTSAHEHSQRVLRVLLQDRVPGIRAYAAALLNQGRGPGIARTEPAPPQPAEPTEPTERGRIAGARPDGGSEMDAGPAAENDSTRIGTTTTNEDTAASDQRQRDERLAQARALFAQATRAGQDSDGARLYKLLLRARALCATAGLRSHPDCIEISAGATYKLASQFERDARFTEAMNEYQALLSSSGKSPSAVEYRREAQRAAVRMGLRLGRVVVHTQSGGRCREVVYWLAPGKGTVRVGSTQEEVSVRAGDVLHRGTCP